MPETAYVSHGVTLTSESRLLGVGSCDALTAGLIESMGFDLVWVGSFESSTARLIPDANLITYTEVAENVRAVRARCRLPIFVDGDNGYGSDECAVRAAETFALAGADAFCIEDNAFPKRNSLYATSERTLERPEVFARRIKELASMDSGLKIVARTEALVAGAGADEAVERLNRYRDAGADALFVQANSRHIDLLSDVVARVRGTLPIILAPTAAPATPADAFFGMGANVVLFANVVSRTVIQAVTRMLAELRRSPSLDSVRGHIADLDTVFRLTGAQDWNQA
jgi:2-methylisocitrate lyase-like PEP mutase family enzyme